MDDDKQKEKNLQDLVLAEFKKGKVTLFTIEGLATMPLSDIIHQPASGILYDLDLLEEQIFFTDRRGVRDFAAAKIIRALKTRVEELEAIVKSNG